MVDKLYHTLKEAIAITNDMIHVLSSAIVKLMESAVTVEIQFAEVESKSSSKVRDDWRGRRCH